MGWTYTSRARGTSNRDWFQSQFGDNCRILDAATVRGTFYAACMNPAKPGTVFAIICLTRWVPKDRYNFGYKDMDEDMGPCEDYAPARILDQLTATDSENAQDWRERCRRNLQLPRIRPGDVIRLDRPAHFGERQFSEFRKVEYRGRRNVYHVDGFGFVRINPVLYGYTVIGHVD